MKRDTQVMTVVATVLLVAVGTIGWWFGSLEGAGELAQAVTMLIGSICALAQTGRLSRAAAQPSPLLACGAVLGLGAPFLTRTAGPVFTVVLVLSVVFIWIGIGIARREQRA